MSHYLQHLADLSRSNEALKRQLELLNVNDILDAIDKVSEMDEEQQKNWLTFATKYAILPKETP